jgi:tRNA nucleotidyltransferase/poly(A) polymerase
MIVNPVTKISVKHLAKFVDKDTAKILKILTEHHIPTRIVGGAVRDLLLERQPRDLDFVVDADPAEIVYLFEMYQLPSDLSGISHGTVKAVFGYGEHKNKVEVTSLAYRINMQDNRPKIQAIDDWEVDATMRDLSINSLSVDTEGNVYDYTGGYEDLKNQRIRMLRFTKDNIANEPNQIMRYFRAISLFENPKLIQSDLEFVSQNAHLLKDQTDDKRVIMNLITVQQAPNSKKILKLMCLLGFKKYLPYLPC